MAVPGPGRMLLCHRLVTHALTEPWQLVPGTVCGQPRHPWLYKARSLVVRQ